MRCSLRIFLCACTSGAVIEGGYPILGSTKSKSNLVVDQEGRLGDRLGVGPCPEVVHWQDLAQEAVLPRWWWGWMVGRSGQVGSVARWLGSGLPDGGVLDGTARGGWACHARRGRVARWRCATVAWHLEVLRREGRQAEVASQRVELEVHHD